MQMAHKNEARVVKMLSLEKKEQKEEMKNLWEGIDKYNSEEIEKKPTKPNIQEECTLTKNKEYVKWSLCGFYGSKTYFFVHKRNA